MANPRGFIFTVQRSASYRYFARRFYENESLYIALAEQNDDSNNADRSFGPGDEVFIPHGLWTVPDQNQVIGEFIPCQEQCVIQSYPRTTTENPIHKQYVNLTPDTTGNTKHYGNILEIWAFVAGYPSDTSVDWEVLPGNNNSKRDHTDSTPEPRSIKNLFTNDEYSVHPVGGASCTVGIQHGCSGISIDLGLAGGDSYTVTALINQQEVATWEIVTWRKLWYQFCAHVNQTLPSMNLVQQTYRNAYIEFEEDNNQITFDDQTLGEVFIGRHNHDSYKNLFSPQNSQQTIQLMLCDERIDPAPSPGPDFIQFSKADLTTRTIEFSAFEDYIFVNPTLSNSSFIKWGVWREANNHSNNGGFTDQPSLVNDSTGLITLKDRKTVEVTLPVNATRNSNFVIEMGVKLIIAVKGRTAGQVFTYPHTIVTLKTENDQGILVNRTARGISHIIAHEFGHVLSMVPAPVKNPIPLGFSYDDHPFRYSKNGEHCYYGCTPNFYDQRNRPIYLFDALNQDGTCLMFESTHDEMDFCEYCLPFLKANSVLNLVREMR